MPSTVKPARPQRHEIPAQVGGLDDLANDRSSTLTGLLVFAAPLVVLAALVLEVVAGEAATATAGSYSWVPLTWPSPLRATYWLGIGAIAVGHRIGLARLGSAPRPMVTLTIAAPFAVFAAGIALGAPWATWH